MEIIDNIIETKFETGLEKVQIVLTHTSRTIFDYMVSIKYRFGGKPFRLPHYIIGRDGKVINLLNDTTNGRFTNNDRVNEKAIVISLENLGWLEKEPLKLHHINWIGNIYKEKVFDRKWRDYFFWQPYTDIQLEKTAELCKELSEKHKIQLKCVGHNTKVKGVESFLGIITRSNFDEFATDVSPAFDFEKFNKLLNNEELR
jgi:N-acetyl-anhydromuramyl-L-alanine amidase AmpD